MFDSLNVQAAFEALSQFIIHVAEPRRRSQARGEFDAGRFRLRARSQRSDEATEL